MVNFFCVLSGGRLISVFGHNLDVVQEPRMVVTVPLSNSQNERRKRRRRRRSAEQKENVDKTLGRPARMVVDTICSGDPQCSVGEVCVYLCVCLHEKHFSFFIDFLSPCPISSWSAVK